MHEYKAQGPYQFHGTLYTDDVGVSVTKPLYKTAANHDIVSGSPAEGNNFVYLQQSILSCVHFMKLLPNKIYLCLVLLQLSKCQYIAGSNSQVISINTNLINVLLKILETSLDLILY
jgi:hypothetical protein